MENSKFKNDLYYGSLKPLENGFFEQSKINPFGISSESGGVCLTTSPREASLCYATPPIDTDNTSLVKKYVENLNLENVFDLRRSEWYSKSEAILIKENSKKNVDYQSVLEKRNEICEQSNPIVYKCNVEIYSPFRVSRNVTFDVGNYSEMGDIGKFIASKYYPEAEILKLDNYQSYLRMVLFQSGNMDMSEADDLSKKYLKSFTRQALKDPTNKLNTEYFYSQMIDRLNEHGLQGKHTDIFKGIHDSIILEEPKNIYANANYKDNQHVLVFNVKNIHFNLSNESNVDLQYKHDSNKRNKKKIKI